MIITAQLFEAYLKCPMKCYRKFRNESGSSNSYDVWSRNRNREYFDNYVKRMGIIEIPMDGHFTGATNIPPYISPNWQFIIELSIQTESLKSTLQVVERTLLKVPQKNEDLIPIRLYPLNKLRTENRLCIAFDSLVLSEKTGVRVRIGKIVHGDHYIVTKVKVEGLYTQVNKLLSKITFMLSNSAPPDIVLRNHCTECEFETICIQDAIEHDDLGLLSNITDREKKKLNTSGIKTITHLSYTFRPCRRPRRLLGKQEKYNISLKALAIRERKIYFASNERFG